MPSCGSFAASCWLRAGRAVQLSDEPLLSEMRVQLQAKEFRIGVAIESIVKSRQFRDIRGTDVAYDQ